MNLSAICKQTFKAKEMGDGHTLQEEKEVKRERES
jgi:hypothetical protein